MTTTGALPFDEGATLITERPTLPPTKLDVLIVIDDSPSMADGYAEFAGSLGDLAEMYGTHYFDIHVAVTTTSVPGAACADIPSAAGGALLTDSCRAHLDDFWGPNEHEPDGPWLDARTECERHCPFETLVREPSPLEEDSPELAVRPWFENTFNARGDNLGDGQDFVSALTCASLRGFGGCPMESPIEAARRAVTAMTTPGDPAYGFFREGSWRRILILSNEDDCSHPEWAASIFEPDSAFAEGGSASPSAICHRAGTSCSDEHCAPAMRGLDGALVDDPEQAVLLPPEALRETLDAAGLDPLPYVLVVGGVEGTSDSIDPWPDVGSEPEWSDPTWVEAHGWGWACESESGLRAQPSARTGALQNSFDPNAGGGGYYEFPLCAWHWWGWETPVLAHGPENHPTVCVPWGALETDADGQTYARQLVDLDRDTALTDPDCRVLLVDRNTQGPPEFVHEVPPCVEPESPDEKPHPPGDALVCWERSTGCEYGGSGWYTESSDVGFIYRFREGHGPPHDSLYRTECALGPRWLEH